MAKAMRISEFVDKHGEELGITRHAIYDLIRNRHLEENVHYRTSYRGVYQKFTVIESNLIKFLKGYRGE